MQEKLRRRYQIQKEVSRGGYFEGEIEVSNLTRLAEVLLSDEARINIQFGFSQSEYDGPMVDGRLETSLTVECQRCLNAMQIPLELEFKLLLNAADDLVAESSIDMVFSEDGWIDIFEVVEDELILGLPLVTTHDNKACNEFWRAQEQDPGSATKENPFSVLAKLKTIN
jgi:uncharacterized protein